MKKFNLYYLISTVTLVFMLFMFFQTLKVTGWFDDLSPGEQVRQMVLGQYGFQTSLSSDEKDPGFAVTTWIDPDEQEWLLITRDTSSFLQVRVSDFEDEQVLLELFQTDSIGQPQRLEGCEVLLLKEESGIFSGGTIGDFCGLKSASQEYLILDLEINKSGMLLQIESRQLDDQRLLNKAEYVLERLGPR